MSVLFSANQSCLYITCDMIYVIHGNKITFIAIVIVIVNSLGRKLVNVCYVHICFRMIQ